jgi:hypothetical protein
MDLALSLEIFRTPSHILNIQIHHWKSLYQNVQGLYHARTLDMVVFKCFGTQEDNNQRTECVLITIARHGTNLLWLIFCCQYKLFNLWFSSLRNNKTQMYISKCSFCLSLVLIKYFDVCWHSVLFFGNKTMIADQQNKGKNSSVNSYRDDINHTKILKPATIRIRCH